MRRRGAPPHRRYVREAREVAESSKPYKPGAMTFIIWIISTVALSLTGVGILFSLLGPLIAAGFIYGLLAHGITPQQAVGSMLEPHGKYDWANHRRRR